MKFDELVRKLEVDIQSSSLLAVADCNPEIHDVSVLDESFPGTVSFVESRKFAAKLDQISSSALILPRDSDLQAVAQSRNIAWIETDQPRLLFAKAISLFYQPFQPGPAIHPTATVHPDAQIGRDVYIGPHVVVPASARIGDQVCIHANVVLYPRVKIGARTVLHANCTIHERTQLGADCVIHSGAVIGSEGFGFVPTPEGWVKMHQSGRTVLEDGVEVGCNSAIDRPAAGETFIGRNSKIDNLVQIGHSCRLGQNCLVAGHGAIAGSSKLGNWVTLAGRACLCNNVTMGDRSIATGNSMVHKDVAPGEVVSGSPAIPHNLFLKASAVYNRLPEIYSTLKQLKRQLTP